MQVKRRSSRASKTVFGPQSHIIVLALGFLALSSLRAFATVDEPPSFNDQYAALTEADMGSATPAHEPSSAAVPDSNPIPQALDARSSYRLLIEKEAKREGFAPEIAEAVMAVESGYNPGAIGGVGEIGLMQILPSTARMLGFAGSNADLAVPATNIHYGVTYLAQAWRLAGGDLCTATMKYRAGHGETRFSYLSVNYCVAVRGKLMARGFHVRGTVPVATFGEPGGGGGGCRKRCIGVGRIGTVNLAALNTKLSALVVQVRAGR